LLFSVGLSFHVGVIASPPFCPLLEPPLSLFGDVFIRLFLHRPCSVFKAHLPCLLESPSSLFQCPCPHPRLFLVHVITQVFTSPRCFDRIGLLVLPIGYMPYSRLISPFHFGHYGLLPLLVATPPTFCFLTVTPPIQSVGVANFYALSFFFHFIPPAPLPSSLFTVSKPQLYTFASFACGPSHGTSLLRSPFPPPFDNL